MNLQLEEQLKLTEIINASSGDIRKAVLAAYEEGMLMGAMRAAQRLGQTSVQAPNTGAGDDNGDEADADDAGSLSESDKRAMVALGLDVSKTYIHRNSRLTITGYKPSRWKYPISVQTQNGRKLKCSANFLKACRIV